VAGGSISGAEGGTAGAGAGVGADDSDSGLQDPLLQDPLPQTELSLHPPPTRALDTTAAAAAYAAAAAEATKAGLEPAAVACYAAAAAAALEGLGMPFSTPGVVYFQQGSTSEAALTSDAQPTVTTAGGTATGGRAAGSFTFPAPPPMNHFSPRPDSALAAALASARTAAAAGQERLQAADRAWQREQDAAATLARQIAEAEALLAQASGAPPGATSSGSTGHPTTSTVVTRHDPADPFVAQLHYQAGGVQNIGQLIRVVLDPASTSYARWRDQVILTLRRYALDDHVLADPLAGVQTASWLRLDSIVLSWILNTVNSELQDMLRNTPSARQAWLAIEGQFQGNAEARALQLDVRFRTFEQGDLAVGEYCRTMKAMADSLGDLGWPVEDRALVLQILRGVSDRYAHIRWLIVRQRPFPTYLQVCDDLLMEEITLGAWAGSAPPGLSLLLQVLRPPPRLSPPLHRPVHLHRTPHLWPLFPPGQAGVEGAAGKVLGVARRKRARAGAVVVGGGRPWRSTAAATSSSCLALLQQPLVRAHRDVALPGTWWRASSTGRHVRGCPSGVLSTGVPPDDPVGHTFRRLTGAGRLE
jgi:hypothetical protein